MAIANIPSIRFGAGFLARTFARFVKDLVDIAKEISSTSQQQNDQVSTGQAAGQLEWGSSHQVQQTDHHLLYNLTSQK